MRPKSKFFLVILLLSGLGAGLGAARLQYRPTAPLDLSERFLALLNSGNWEAAYGLTEQNPDSGDTLENFQARVRRQLSDFEALCPDWKLEIREVHPFQSYGNRIRRWVSRRPIDIEEASVRYLLVCPSQEVGAPFLPFEVRMAKRGSQWRVVYFQSHAL